MIHQNKINKENLASFLNGIAKSGKELIAPRYRASSVVFAKTDDFSQIAIDYIQTALSAKSVIFPRCEELFSYELTEGKNPKIKELIVQENEVVVFGLHPCDAYSFNYLFDFFEKENPDFHLAKRKEKTTFISLSCKTGDEYCFCTSVGVSPSDTRGSDMTLTEMNDGNYYVEVLTDKGEKLFNDHKNLFADSEIVDKTKYTAQIPERFNLKAAQDKLDKVFETELWKEQSLACLCCGACAFVCPTCTCFDIQDNSNLNDGSRIRCWDSCGLGLFTLHASGHNPRETQSQRWRQRLMHKFDYSVENLGIVSCVGCGRCARACPAQMNIIEHIISIEGA